MSLQHAKITKDSLHLDQVQKELLQLIFSSKEVLQRCAYAACCGDMVNAADNLEFGLVALQDSCDSVARLV